MLWLPAVYADCECPADKIIALQSLPALADLADSESRLRSEKMVNTTISSENGRGKSSVGAVGKGNQ